MQTAASLRKWAPRATLESITPYGALYDKYAKLEHLRAIGAKGILAHRDSTRTLKLDPKAWEGRLVGYSVDSKSYCNDNPEKGNLRESRKVIFIETLSAMPGPAPVEELGDVCSGYQKNDDLLRDLMDYQWSILRPFLPVWAPITCSNSSATSNASPAATIS